MRLDVRVEVEVEIGSIESQGDFEDFLLPRNRLIPSVPDVSISVLGAK